MFPIRAIVGGSCGSLTLSFVGVILMKIEVTVNIGAWLIVAMPFVTAITATYFLRGPEALCLAMILAIVSIFSAVALVLGPREIQEISFLLAHMFFAAIGGVVFGIFLRPVFRRWFDPPDLN